MAPVTPTNTVTTKATAMETATAETSPPETTTAVESATAEASSVETTTASAPAVASCPSCVSERDRGDPY
jgi:hypothetical protein